MCKCRTIQTRKTVFWLQSHAYAWNKIGGAKTDSHGVEPVLDVVAAITLIVLDFKQCFESDILQTRQLVFSCASYLLSYHFWKLWNCNCYEIGITLKLIGFRKSLQSLYDLKSAGSSLEVPLFIVFQKFWKQTHRHYSALPMRVRVNYYSNACTCTLDAICKSLYLDDINKITLPPAIPLRANRYILSETLEPSWPLDFYRY